MKETVRVASGQGFWGDLLTAPYDQVTKGRIDYIMMDYLAEVTMSIMQKQRRKDSRLGYAKDLIPLLEQILPLCVERNIKVVTNGGGVNPTACRDAIFQAARKLSIRNLTIGVVVGDDILNRLDELREKGIDLKNMETGESLDCVRDRVMNANVYFGAWPIVEALSQGAQVVITGRTTDTALTYAPMVYEFGWSKTDWDKLAAGTVSGHILECGAQASGGNFSLDWRGVPDLAHIGFPIAEVYEKGEIVITKHENTGGIVSSATVKEQLLYEIGDPRNYVTPDCIADFTTIHLEEEGKNRVRVTGVKGRPATEFYKVSMSYADGFTAVGTLTYAWPDALDKAKKADEVLRTRLADLRLEFDEIRTEFLGYNSSHGPLSGPPGNLNEVVLRIGVRAHDYDAVERFGKEITPLILAGPPAVTGFGGGRPKPSEVIAYWPALIPKSEVSWEVIVEEL
ncbi:MAG: acyclic terpene utilization AtuA family protein [Bacteroidota bacterium]